MKQRITTLDALKENGLLKDVSPELRDVENQFSILITEALQSAINKDNPFDPIAKQFVPSTKELNAKPEELLDPIGDHAHSPITGLIHRYPDRVLLKLTTACAVHCRFCFRRNSLSDVVTPENLEEVFAYIREHREIWEVILSGGDPFVVSDRQIANIVQKINSIDHVKIIRVHTRVPVADPDRITPDLISALRSSKAVYILLHCNHARELTKRAREACAKLIDAGIPMFSQSVLLRGVNDDPETLRDLMKVFVETRIKPYYLHHGDLAQGTSHFRVSLEKGRELMKSLRGYLSGLCQPTYVLDLPGGFGKIPVGPSSIAATENGYVVEDFRGERHEYKDILD